MRILDKNLRQGRIKVSTETGDDLWYLHTLLEEGDVVTGDSEYKLKLGGSESKTKIAKKRVWVAIKLEKSEFGQGNLRLLGIVVDGSEEVPRGSHHGLDVSEGTQITIHKEKWYDYHLTKLDEAQNSSGISTLIVLFDREQAIIVKLKPQGYEVLLELKGDVPKKGVDEAKQQRFYEELVAKLEEIDARQHSSHIVAASPSFWKEYLRKVMPTTISGKVVYASVSSVDTSAIPELLKSEELQGALAGERAAREEHLLEEVMAALGRDALVYGIEDVDAAIAEGNLKTLYVSEAHLLKAREEGGFARLEALMRKANDLGAPVHLLSTQDVTRKIDGLGGVVAIKRW